VRGGGVRRAVQRGLYPLAAFCPPSLGQLSWRRLCSRTRTIHGCRIDVFATFSLHSRFDGGRRTRRREYRREDGTASARSYRTGFAETGANPGRTGACMLLVSCAPNALFSTCITQREHASVLRGSLWCGCGGGGCLTGLVARPFSFKRVDHPAAGADVFLVALAPYGVS